MGSVSKVARPPDKSLVEFVSDVLLCRQTRSVGRAQNVMYDDFTFKQAQINKSSQIPKTKVIPPKSFLNRQIL